MKFDVGLFITVFRLINPGINASSIYASRNVKELKTLIEITLDGGNLNECEGDCENNDECNGDLICHHRHDHYTGLHTPGCKGDGAIVNNLFDWCVQPNPTSSCWTDYDSEKNGLVYSADTTGSCSGSATSGWKYCTCTLVSSCSSLEQAEAVVVISTCYHPDENYWKIVDAGTNTIVHSGVLPYQDRAHIFDNLCLSDGEYVFTIEDWGGVEMDFHLPRLSPMVLIELLLMMPKLHKVEVTLEVMSRHYFQYLYQRWIMLVHVMECFEITTSSPTSSTPPTKFPTFPPRTLTPSTSFPTSMSHAACIAACDNALFDSVCEDDTSYTFDLMSVQDSQKKSKTCGWLTANRNKAEKRIARYCTKDFDNRVLISACVKSCGLCTI